MVSSTSGLKQRLSISSFRLLHKTRPTTAVEFYAVPRSKVIDQTRIQLDRTLMGTNAGFFNNGLKRVSLGECLYASVATRAVRPNLHLFGMTPYGLRGSLRTSNYTHIDYEASFNCELISRESWPLLVSSESGGGYIIEGIFSPACNGGEFEEINNHLRQRWILLEDEKSCVGVWLSPDTCRWSPRPFGTNRNWMSCNNQCPLFSSYEDSTTTPLQVIKPIYTMPS